MSYRTIVCDPPWDYGTDHGRWPSSTPGKPIHRESIPYPAMSLLALTALPIGALAEKDAWPALWTTNRFLPQSFGLLGAWGFEYRQTLVWAKRGPSPFGGTWAANGAEFLIAAARGTPRVKERWPEPSVITTSANGGGSHSSKPEVWLDLIEHCCDGPYLEMFARRNRLGWDTWGDEALLHIEMTA
jgi:N6-adenosine-specific RNA methylase IME4